MKKIFPIALALFLLFGSASSIAQEQKYPVMLYRKGWEQLTAKEADKIMEQPMININTGEPFKLKMEQSEDGNVQYVSTPREYSELIKEGYYFSGYTTYDIIDNGLFRNVVTPLIYYMKAKSSKHSYVRDFTFDKNDPLSMLPLTFINWVGSDQRKAIERATKQNKSWRDISPNVRVIKVEKDRIDLYDTFGEDFYKDGHKYKGNMASNVLSLAVLGDFNGDGYEDVVFECAHYLVEGTGRVYYFTVLTRKSEGAILEDITDEVDKTLWAIKTLRKK